MTEIYPDDWSEVQAVRFRTPLILYRGIEAVKMKGDRDALYVLNRDFTVQVTVDGEWHYITAPEGMLTDLASVPRIARSVAGRVGPHLEAAIIHDWLYTAWQDIPGRGARPRDRTFADRVFYEGMVASDVPFLQRQTIYRAVRLFGWGPYSNEEHPRFLRDTYAQ